MGNVSFKVDGEWFTDFIRTLYYAEDKPYEECKAKLLKSLCLEKLTDAEKEELAEQIIYGDKKFVGVNSLDLVDDTEFDVYNYSRIPRPKRFEEGKGITGILTTDGIFAECSYQGHAGIINFVDGENHKCAGAIVFSTGIPGDTDSAYVNFDMTGTLSKYQLKWYKKNKKYLNDRQIRQIERFIK